MISPLYILVFRVVIKVSLHATEISGSQKHGHTQYTTPLADTLNRRTTSLLPHAPRRLGGWRGGVARRRGGSVARRRGGSVPRWLGGVAARPHRRALGSAARRLRGSAARRLGGSAARWLGSSAVGRCGGSAARRLGGAAARRPGGPAARRLGRCGGGSHKRRFNAGVGAWQHRGSIGGVAAAAAAAASVAELTGVSKARAVSRASAPEAA